MLPVASDDGRKSEYLHNFKNGRQLWPYFCDFLSKIGPKSQQPDQVSLEVTCSGALSLIEKCSQRLLMMMMVVG
jgi:hypothetical protein